MNRRIGIVCLSVALALVLAQPLLAPHDPMKTDAAGALRSPGAAHLLGTDAVGRDVMARLAAGAWVSLEIAAIAILLSSLLGVLTGCAAGLAGGIADRAISGFVDLMLAFPKFVILLNLAAIFTLGSPIAVGLVIGGVSWMATARLVRTEVLSLRERPYVEAARAAGAGSGRILARHLAPQVARLVLESADLRFASAILAAASLDYLGVGLSADRPTWGRMILDGQSYLREAPWIALPAVGLLCLTTVGLVLAGGRSSRPAA
jgi:peptide/nickel transport system permease protein